MILFLTAQQLVELGAELKDKRASDLAFENVHGEPCLLNKGASGIW